MDDIFDTRESAMSILDTLGNTEKGYGTGIASLDEVINGYKKGEFIIIAGNSSMGKSSYARVSALEISKKNLVLMASLEMSSRDISELCLTSLAELNYTEVIQSGNTDKYRTRLQAAAKELSKRKLMIWDSSFVSTSALDNKIEQINEKERVDCVIIDYLQLMSTPVRENRQTEIATISRELKLLALKYDIPIIALSQLNRACEARDDKRPRISDLRDSGALGQDVDKCLMLHRPAYYDIDSEDDGVAEIIIAKNRKGPRNRTVPCAFIAEKMWFYDINNFEDF